MSTGGHGKRNVDELLKAELAGGATFAEAAKAGRVSRSTVQRRMADPAFRAGVVAQRDEMATAVRGQLLAHATRAARVVADLAEGAASEAVRLRAARTLLELGLDRGHRYDHMNVEEVERIIGQVLHLAHDRMPEDEFGIFVRDVSALGA
jgi:hypothetical protein